ncbi:butyrophilin subfamily 1 member A1-like, partial [Neolamprologus brichardi]|uniref:butyrophilin subfamily 1 member A1-like n=1 Tax=Neolamprologus brichardi TaxID=32507 RepID=UPI00164387A8
NRFDSPVMHYQSKKFKYEEASYVGRVSFGLKDAASGGLNSGDVSLKLLNVTIEDAGDYICLVSSNQGYDRSPVNLIVTASGSPPFLSVAWGEDDKVNVSCESEGWYPQPVLRWSDKKQDVKPQSLVYRNLSSGLFLVHSWLLLSSTSEPSCSVGLSDKEVKEAKVSLGPLCKTLEPESSPGGWVAFALLLVATLVLAALGVMYYRKKVRNAQSGRDQIDGNSFSETEKLLAGEDGRLSEARNHYVNVKLEVRNTEYLKVAGNRVRETHPDDLPGNPFPDGDIVTCVTAIKGTSGFSSGKHYWEVSMKRDGLGIKRSWWVGVTSAAEIPNNSSTSFPNTSNGFWFLCKV